MGGRCADGEASRSIGKRETPWSEEDSRRNYTQKVARKGEVDVPEAAKMPAPPPWRQSEAVSDGEGGARTCLRAIVDRASLSRQSNGGCGETEMCTPKLQAFYAQIRHVTSYDTVRHTAWKQV